MSHKNVNTSSHRKGNLTVVYQFELWLKVRGMPSKLSLPRQGPWNLVWVKQAFELSEVELTEFHCIQNRNGACVFIFFCCADKLIYQQPFNCWNLPECYLCWYCRLCVMEGFYLVIKCFDGSKTFLIYYFPLEFPVSHIMYFCMRRYILLFSNFVKIVSERHMPTLPKMSSY